MALYAVKTFSNANQYIADLKDFAEANGWTIDFFGLYSGNNRLHLHKGSSHFEVWWRNAATVYLCGCTAYNAAAAPNAQPNTSNAITWLYGSGTTEVYFVSSGQSLYLGANNASKQVLWGGLCTITEKVGNWSGGILVTGDDGGSPQNYFNFLSASSQFNSLYINGVWTPQNYNAVVNALYGRMRVDSVFSDNTPPSPHNLGIVPMRAALFVRNAANASMLHPVGFVPGILSAGPSLLYDNLDVIDVGGVPHLVTFRYWQQWFLIRLEQ